MLSTARGMTLLYGYRERVTDTTLPQIAELPRVLPELFAGAAARAQQAGFDGVELHYAHAYTMASFLSALNQRHDGYGGAREHRIRLPLEVYRAVRRRVGGGFAVGCRYLSEDCLPHGNSVEDAVYFGVELARAGMDFLSLSRGGKFEDAKQPKVGRSAYPYTGPRVTMHAHRDLGCSRPFGRNVPAVAAVRAGVRAAGLRRRGGRRRHLHLRPGRGAAARRRGRRRRGGAAEPRHPDCIARCGSARQRSAALHLTTNYCRGSTRCTRG